MSSFCQPADYVDPFIGTGKFEGPSMWGFYGSVYPGAAAPSGMVQITPETRVEGEPVGYYHEDERIHWFSAVDHFSGFPDGSSGNIRFAPVFGDRFRKIVREGVRFEHENEKAVPGYYSVKLSDYPVKIEVAATVRSCLLRLIYGKIDEPGIAFSGVDDLQLTLNRRLIHGRWRNYFFAVELNQPYARSERTDDGVIVRFAGKDSNACEALVKMGFSRTGLDGAIKNLGAEIPGWDFENVRKRTWDAWNRRLGKIEVAGGTEDRKKIFYTALYHSSLIPFIVSDVDGSYPGKDGKIRKKKEGHLYDGFSPWDTFRCLHPLLTIIEPERQRDIVRSLLFEYERAGRLPAPIMTGNHAIPIITDSYFKGIRDFDLKLAYEAMRKCVMEPPFNQRTMEEYIRYGYVPAEFEESVTHTLEYAYNDWALAEFCRDIDERETYIELINRSFSYRNLFNIEERLMLPRFINSDWAGYGGYKEGDKWNYSWFVPHNMSDLVNLMGGDDEFASHLESVFEKGLYIHDNEPPIHYPYLFNYAGKPGKTQKWVRYIMDTHYSTCPGGIPGNDDLGALSSWYVFSAMGFYPVCPGRTAYEIGTPVFPETVIHLNGGRKFRIISDNVSSENIYIQSALLNGRPFQQSWIDHADIVRGGELRFRMGKNTEPSWASSGSSVPPSVTGGKSDIVVRDFELSSNKVRSHEVFSVTVDLENMGETGSVKITAIIDGIPVKTVWSLVEGGAKRSVGFESRLYEPGERAVSVNGLPAVAVNVVPVGEKGTTTFERRFLRANPMCRLGETVRMEAGVKNIGSYKGVLKLKGVLGSCPGKEYSVELLPGEFKKVKLEYQCGEVGIHTFSAPGFKRKKIKIYKDRLDSEVLKLDFDEGQGTFLRDRSGFDNHGILTGEARWVRKGGRNALRMGGTSHIELPESRSLDLTDDSLTMMIRYLPEDEIWTDFFTKGDYIFLQVLRGSYLNFAVGGWGRGECRAPLPDDWYGRWHHIAGVCDGSSLRLYIDGELKNTCEISGKIGHTPFPWNIGRNSEITTGRYTKGCLDDARIYSEPLTGDEIRSIACL